MSDNNAARRKVLLASWIGTFVEYYDFALYGLFATTIANLFFPEIAPTAALLSTFAVFAVGFVIRPLGAVAFGHLGDRIGRRPALIAAVMLMSAGTVALGLLPSYSQIGIVAPVLLLSCRLVQGFSAGGEYSGANIFMIEYVPPSRRGRYASVAPLGTVLGFAFGALVAVVVTSATSDVQLASWGWRVPFLIAAPLALIGMYLRLWVEESPVFAALDTEGAVESFPVIEAFKIAKRPMLILAGYVMTNAVAFYLLSTFLTSHLTATGKFSATGSLVVQVVAMLGLAAALVFAGYAVDIVGRKRLAVGAALGLGIWAVPTFALIEHSSLFEACLIVVVYSVLFSGISVTCSLAIVELFPARVRSSASALAYQFSYALFGGTAPYVATWMVSGGHHFAPGYYLAGVCAVSAVAAAIGIGNRELTNDSSQSKPNPTEGKGLDERSTRSPL